MKGKDGGELTYGCDNSHVTLIAVLVHAAFAGLEHNGILDGKAGSVVVVRFNSAICASDSNGESSDRSLRRHNGRELIELSQS